MGKIAVRKVIKALTPKGVSWILLDGIWEVEAYSKKFYVWVEYNSLCISNGYDYSNNMISNKVSWDDFLEIYTDKITVE